MSAETRRQQNVRRMLAGHHPPLPHDIAARAVERGHRMQRRRRAAQAAAWVLVLALIAVLTVWAATASPWEAGPRATTPPVEGV
ncbi:hypothetical protein ACH41E_12400 [Streptomyces sp. NPDC020412]|uniref:hypothetical protein n=1 Tax=Streptomyces sp. NPDC020412 TaxID=3365073 RepID=UPI0037A08302